MNDWEVIVEEHIWAIRALCAKSNSRPVAIPIKSPFPFIDRNLEVFHEEYARSPTENAVLS
jgi:hypothetical protein